MEEASALRTQAIPSSPSPHEEPWAICTLIFVSGWSGNDVGRASLTMYADQSYYLQQQHMEYADHHGVVVEPHS